MITRNAMRRAIRHHFEDYAKASAAEDHSPYHVEPFDSEREWVDFWMAGHAGDVAGRFERHGDVCGFDPWRSMRTALARACDLDAINETMR